jgi:RNA polymerase sigma-32 factor
LFLIVPPKKKKPQDLIDQPSFVVPLEADVEAFNEELTIEPVSEEEMTEEPDTESLHLPAVVEVSSDPLKLYLKEVSRYPLLTAEEEFILASQLKSEYDANVAKKLVVSNLRLVVKIAFEYKNFYANIMDLIQEGNYGLIKAVGKFDPEKGARLAYYASWWVRSYILKYLLENFRLVKVGTTQAQKKLYYHLMREKKKFEAQGLVPAPKLIAKALNVREKDVIEMDQRLSSYGGEVSLDAPLEKRSGSGQATSFVDRIEDKTPAADEQLAEQQMLTLLREGLDVFEKGLGEKEKYILKERLLAEEPKTLQELANKYGFTRERARQLEAKILNRLRELLHSKVE